jgi:hypothetical protein
VVKIREYLPNDFVAEAALVFAHAGKAWIVSTVHFLPEQCVDEASHTVSPKFF